MTQNEKLLREANAAIKNYAKSATTAPTPNIAEKNRVKSATTPNIYQQTLANYQPVNYDNVQYRSVDAGFRAATDTDRAMWQRIIDANAAGDTDRVTSLLNDMRGQGNFSGYYGDDGLYYGFARGYGGAADSSYQPVLAGELISSGKLDTNTWLTPDGKYYTGTLGGSLSGAGNWSYGDKGTVGATTGAATRANVGAGGTESPPAANAGTNIYKQALSAAMGNPAATPVNTAPTTAYQDYLADYGKAPEYGGSKYDALRDEAMDAAKTPFQYALESDPAYQAYAKQYAREGRRASEDTMGQYAAMTGGRPSTAAVTAASQAGNYYASQLADKIPELYNQAYTRYLQEYQRQLGIAGQYNTYSQQDYNQFRDRLGQWNTDRNFQYQLNRDAVGDARYDQEWAQKLKEYADSQGWKATEWQQYLREYEDQMSQADRDFAYKQYLDAWEMEQQENDTAYQREQNELDRERQARLDAMDEADWKAGYGDLGGAEALGVDASEARGNAYAYAPDGSTYDIGSSKGQYFIQYAGAGQTMTGGDGSTWTKNADGTVTIRKDGKSYTYGSTAEETGSAGGHYGYGGGGSSSGGSAGSETDAFAALSAAGIETEGDAYNWLLANGSKYGVTGTTAANKIAKYYAQSLAEDQGNRYSEADINRAWSLVNDKNATAATKGWAEKVLADTYGMDFGQNGEIGGTGDQSLEYDDIDRDMQNMADRGASWNEIRTELDAEFRDGRITKAEYDTLAEKFHGVSDNVPNGEMKHKDGRPQSKAFSSVLQQANTHNSRGNREKAIDTLLEAAESGKIHEYEIDIIMDRLGL